MPRNDISSALLTQLYNKKLLSKKEVADRLNCNISTIYRKMLFFNIPSRKQNEAVRIAMSKKIIKIYKKSLNDLYINKKLSIIEISGILKHDPEIIKRELIRNKIQLRKKSEAIHFARSKKKIPKETIKSLYYNSFLTQEQIARKLGKSRRHILLLMQEYNLKTRGPSQTLLKYPKQNFSGDLIEKAYLIGFRTGDLSAKLSPSGNLVLVYCTSTKQEQITLFEKIFQKYGFIWIGKPRKDKNRVFMVRLNRTFDFLLPKKDEIPSWILKDKDHFLAFLSGYTDAEGCIGVFNKLARFTVASYDKNILKQAHRRLNKLGIPCNPPRILVKKGYIKSDGGIYRNDHWHLTFAKKSSLLLLFQALEPYLKHQKRINDLQKARANIIERNMRLGVS